jgi:hypothetical protein
VYRYQPPKSNIWGHGLRNMAAAVARERFANFLAAAADKFEFSDASIMVAATAPELVSRLEHLLGAPARNNYIRLNADQCDACIDEVIRLEQASSKEAGVITLMQAFKISHWRICTLGGVTASRMHMYYGRSACLSTLLEFESIEQFHAIAQMLQDMRICRLSQKHLKVIKRPSLKQTQRE